jgi:hypothetical protein
MHREALSQWSHEPVALSRVWWWAQNRSQSRAYVDLGISGTKERRPELDRLISDGHRRKFDAVVVWKFDRFAISEQIDTSTPMGWMIFTVLGSVPEAWHLRWSWALEISYAFRPNDLRLQTVTFLPFCV